MTDWADHLTTLFPEVRLKRYLEMRGADGGPWRGLCALPALWVGLLYDGQALDAAWDLVKDWTDEERAHLRAGVPRHALDTMHRGRPLRDLAMEVLRIAEGGLSRRARNDRWGDDETHFINTLLEVVETGETPATKLLKCYHGEWQGDIDRVFAEFSY
jgi:glutamate--cysteine ligase